ncbi:nuclear transport factor 2 isoform X2 [Cicer arietinum]|uniref:Ras GTPase-activating protein-binding protein 1 isoform X2 n=1 Tax=Cicer arietinum TaxID=3827 RepID=A0A1S2YIN7_CICAR|nr:ras GTPase-activating protein-binding protein 1 isoform X2 [Cicer arietinum]
MAVSEAPQTPTPQMVGNAFVEQYYSILHQNPDQVHRFYHDSSVMSRPEEDGTMITVTTTAEIDKKIKSHDYTSFRVEVLSADAQPSYNNGVMVVVTGCLTGTDNVKRKFAQSFFLAPQDKGFYVLNDVFRYVEEYKSVDIESVPSNDADESAPSEAFTPEPEPNHVPEDIPPRQSVVADTDTNISKEVSLPLENGKLSVTENVIPVNHVKETIHQEQPSSTEKVASNTQEDTPKKSFASIVNALKDNSKPFHLRTSPAKPAVQQPRVISAPAPEAPAPNTDSPLEKNNENAGKAHAIFVANLPMNATVEQLDRVFKKFGPIKPNGIQVRSNKGSCFGFVEFESAASMQSALEASPPVMLDNRRLSIEERRANNDRVRYSSGRGGFRTDNFRGRGNFGGGRGGGFNGRNDFEKRGEFSGRPRGGNNNGNNNGRSNGDAAPRSYQNGGKVTRQPVKVQ